MTELESWGRYPRAAAEVVSLAWRDEHLPENRRSLLPYGCGRSYGDACLNDGGVLIETRRLDHLLRFDAANGVLEAESGVTLAVILELVVPRGFFLPVTPGTKFVTLGGAIANDVHGKNHHRSGTFGRHVLSLELSRSDGTRTTCSPDENANLFRATIGGLGLTGLITRATIRLPRVASSWIAMESVKYGSLDEFAALTAESDASFEYTVAWADSTATGRSLGRGHFLRGNHAAPGEAPSESPPSRPEPAMSVPVDCPEWTLSGPAVRAFNMLYFHRQPARVARRIVGYDPFFYPLDAIGRWNRLYGRRGFHQFQGVVPRGGDGFEAVRELFRRVGGHRTGSFLTVVKTFGDLASPGLLSFPRPGVTVTFDIPHEGEATIAFLRSLDAIVRESGGAVYPAKDSCMPPESFRAYYPKWEEFSKFIDPAFSSSFWRRVTGDVLPFERQASRPSWRNS
jgi:FAD/FMN-containing dehydrogenase